MLRIGFLLVFIAVPLLELALLIKLGSWIGVIPTIAMIFVTAIIGTTVLRRQGLRTLQRATLAVQAGEAPVVPLVEGVLLLVAGAFLITPGLITDTAGALLLVPPIRRELARRGIAFAVANGMVHVGRQSRRNRPEPAEDRAPPGPRWPPGGDGDGRPRRQGGSGPIIEGEFERIDERTVDPDRSDRG